MEGSLASSPPAERGRLAVFGLLTSLGPDQWTKNLMVFAALIFERRLIDPAAVGLSVAAFLIFAALSGVVFLIDDVSDREADAEHPLKRRRAIATGELRPTVASSAAALIGAAARPDVAG